MDEKLIREQIEAMNRNSQALEAHTAAIQAQTDIERELANELTKLNRMAPRAIDRTETLNSRLRELWEQLDRSRRRGGF